MQRELALPDELISAIYQAAVAPAQWPVVLGALCRRMGASFAQLEWVGSSGTSAAVAHWPEVPGAAAPRDLLARLRGALQHAHQTGVDPVIVAWPDDALDAKAEPALLDTPAPARSGPSYPPGHGLPAGVTPPGAEGQAGLLLHRDAPSVGFDRQSHVMLAEIARHARAALRIAWQLDAARFSREIGAAALDQIAYGIVVADATGKVIYANDRAGKLSRAGAYCFKPGCRLAGPTPEATEMLREAVYGVCQAKPTERTLRLPMVASAPSMLLQLCTALVPNISPLPGVAHQRESWALIKLRMPATGRATNTSVLMALFGLTQTEANILPKLVAGESAGQIAASRGVSTATIRAQIRHILSKTGVANQRALAAIIAAVDDA